MAVFMCVDNALIKGEVSAGLPPSTIFPLPFSIALKKSF